MPVFLSKKQAVLFNATDDLQRIGYLTIIGYIITPKNVLFSSKMSKGRVCIYLSRVPHPLLTRLFLKNRHLI